MSRFIFPITFIVAIALCKPSTAWSQKVVSGIQQHDFVKFEAEVKLVDSSYLLIIKLYVTKKEQIQVLKNRPYAQAPGVGVFGELYLQKRVRGTAVNISVNYVCRLPLFDEDFDKTITVDQKHPITDTVCLDNHYPFEIGDYIINVQASYQYKSKTFRLESAAYEFSVPYLPKNSMYN